MPSKVSPWSSRDPRPSRCRECGRPGTAKRVISRRALCTDCGAARANAAAVQVATGAGPHFDEYVRGMAAYVESLTRSPK